MGRHVGNYTAFVCLVLRQANKRGNETPMLFVIPVEVEVSSRESLYSPQHHIIFGHGPIVVPVVQASDSVKHSKSTIPSPPSLAIASSHPIISPLSSTHPDRISSELFTRSFDLYLTNSASLPLQITNISSIRSNPALEFAYNTNTIMQPDPERLFKIAEIKFNALKSKKASQNYGKIIVKTNSSISFSIGFDAQLVYG